MMIQKVTSAIARDALKAKKFDSAFNSNMKTMQAAVSDSEINTFFHPMVMLMATMLHK